MLKQINEQEQGRVDCPDTSRPDNEKNKSQLLVIDDEQSILQILAIALRQAGYGVSTATSAEEAFRMINNFEFDVIVTDVMMPGEDGISLLSRIHQVMPDVPIIIMTGFAQLQMAVNAIKNGAFDFLHKPFDLDYMQQVVSKAVTYANLRRMEKNYCVELEDAVARRTDELKQAVAQLDSTRATLFKAAKDKTEFMTTITHEMRTPMNGVVGALDLLSDTQLSDQQREYLYLARKAADNMVELVDRVLSFSTGIGRGPTALFDLIDLPNAVESAAAAHRSKFARAGLQFDLSIASLVPRRIWCDAKQLTRMLDILLNNALKFTGKGGVSLVVSPEQIEEQHVLINFCVSDTGVGIKPDMLQHIFDPFIQEDASLTRKFGGAGLGLSIARQIAALFNGEIWVESTPGEGSRFYCRLGFELP